MNCVFLAHRQSMLDLYGPPAPLSIYNFLQIWLLLLSQYFMRWLGHQTGNGITTLATCEKRRRRSVIECSVMTQVNVHHARRRCFDSFRRLTLVSLLITDPSLQRKVDQPRRLHPAVQGQTNPSLCNSPANKRHIVV